VFVVSLHHHLTFSVENNLARSQNKTVSASNVGERFECEGGVEVEVKLLRNNSMHVSTDQAALYKANQR